MIKNSEFIDFTATTEICAGKQDLALQLIELFLEELPEFKTELLVAEKNNNRERIGKIIHKFLGSCAICVAPSIKAELANLSAAYKADKNDLLAYIKKLNVEIDDTIEFCAQNNLGSTK